MRTLAEKTIKQWEDGSIPRRAKSELIKKFHERFGYTHNSNTFAELIAKKQQPTPDQDKYLTDTIQEYWNFYNDVAVPTDTQ